MLVNFLDQSINVYLIGLHSAILTKILIGITNLMSPRGFIILSLILLGLLFYKKRWHAIGLAIVSLAGGLFLESLIKIFVHRLRPENGLVPETGFSFPSGHATLAIVFFGLAFYLFKDKIKNRALKYIFIVLNILLILAISFSRVYLNVHWFTDVIAGLALGLFWLMLMIWIFQRQKKHA